jgi:hypothetical protein
LDQTSADAGTTLSYATERATRRPADRVVV